MPDNSDTTVKLAVNAWVGAAANAIVAAKAPGARTSSATRWRPLTIDEYAQFPASSTGDLDATLEVWPSVHAEGLQEVHRGRERCRRRRAPRRRRSDRVVHPDLHGGQNPELATWEGSRVTRTCSRPPSRGTRASCWTATRVRVLRPADRGQPRPGLEGVYAGSEAAELSALERPPEADKDPILMYFWTPHWVAREVRADDVELPEVTPECEAAASDDVRRLRRCAYPADPLYKAFNDDLEVEGAGAAFALLSRVRTRTTTRTAWGSTISDGTDPADAAARSGSTRTPTRGNRGSTPASRRSPARSGRCFTARRGWSAGTAPLTASGVRRCGSGGVHPQVAKVARRTCTSGGRWPTAHDRGCRNMIGRGSRDGQPQDEPNHVAQPAAASHRSRS